MTMAIKTCLHLFALAGFLPLLAMAFAPLRGVSVERLADGSSVDVGEFLASKNSKTMVVFGTYAADFNAIEYGQRLRYYLPALQEKGVEDCCLILNCQPSAAKAYREQLDLPDFIDIWLDNQGEAGRAFGVGRGWLPDNTEISPYLKLFGMLWGLGAWATLPAVIGGYLGNPFTAQPWIEDAMSVGIEKGRWPNNALEISGDGTVVNKFEELPVVGSWPRRPLELATLRLQSMLGISLKYWKELAPDQAALDSGVLTQLGGCVVVENDLVAYEWKDPGICAVANFEDLLQKI